MEVVYIIREETYVEHEGPFVGILACADSYESARIILNEEIDQYLKSGKYEIVKETEDDPYCDGNKEYAISIRSTDEDDCSEEYVIEAYEVEHKEKKARE